MMQLPLSYFVIHHDGEFVATDLQEVGVTERRMSTGMRLPDVTMCWGDVFTMVNWADVDVEDDIDVTHIICAVVVR